MSSTRRRKISSFFIPNGPISCKIKDAATKAVIQDFPGSVYASPVLLEGIQTTVSENHPEWLAIERSVRLGRKSPVPSGRDWGGDFTSQKLYVESPSPEFFKTRSAPFFSTTYGFNITCEKQFPLYVPLTYDTGLFPPTANSSDAVLQAFGATAISRCSPANPVASVTVASLDTFKDGLPHLLGHSLWEERTNLARSAGDEYLNVEFGWMPLVSDVKSFAQAIANMDRLQKQFVRDSGKDIRRRYSFPPRSTTIDTVVKNNVNVGGPFDLSIQDRKPGVPNGVVVRSRRTTVECWFSGAFTYHAPPEFFGSTGEHVDHAIEILGLDLTPDTLWQLAPWSWAADWFSNTGDIINNLSNYSDHGQVLRRGYIMEHSVVRDVYSFSGDVGFDPNKVNFTGHPINFVVVSEMKVRRRATPFGFGVSLSSLSPTQIAIMAALGLTFLA